MKSLKAKFRKTDAHEWSKNDERLLSAVEHGEVDKVTSLLAKKGASAVKLDAEGKSALHVAAMKGQTECLAVILSHGADVSVIDASGFTALHLAAKNNHQDCAKKLIQNKSVLDALDGSGKTALHHAAACGNTAMVQLLCETKCPVNLKDAEGFTPLLLSARHVHADVCSTLLKWGADVNARDKNGRTAVMLASEGSCVAAVQVLVQCGADLRAADSLGHDVLHYAKLSGSAEVRNVLSSVLQRQQADSDNKTPQKTPQHDKAGWVTDDRNSTPKKRKAPPPPISPTQLAGVVSPPYLTPTGTPSSAKSDTPKRFNYKEDEIRSMALKEEIEKLQEEKSMLLETIEDLKQIAEQTEPKAERGGSADGALVATLQAKVAALSLENQQLSQIIKKRPAPQGEDEDSRPNSIDSNASYHSTRADFEHPSLSEVEDASAVEEDPNGGGGGGKELLLLRETLHSVQSKLQESQQENRSLQARLSPVPLGEMAMLESVAELQSKLAATQEKHLRAAQEVQALRAEVLKGGGGGGGGGGAGRLGGEVDDAVMQKVQKLKGCLEQEVKELKAKLAAAEERAERDGVRVRELERRLETAGSQETQERQSHGAQQEALARERAQLAEQHRQAQEEVRVLQVAIKGMVPVEAAAQDFEALKAETGEVIEGLQRRLRELSKSYSETKSELSAVRGQLKTSQSPEPPAAAKAGGKGGDSPTGSVKETPEQQQQELQAAVRRAEESEARRAEALEEVGRLKEELEAQAQATVSLADHAQVVSSLGSAIQELEARAAALQQQLGQRSLQVDALQNRLTVEKERTPDDTVPRAEHTRLSQRLEEETTRLTRLLQDALRKQDQMALEAAAAWQEAREARAHTHALEELAAARLQENNALGAKQREAQELSTHLKKQVENHVASEREKNKKIDDLSKEVAKLKEALNSLSQLSYSGSSAPKRQQQSQQLEALQQQIKQLQYQLTESKKQHHEIVSVYRMHLLYAVQGQMDEDVQKALKQILMMCKMSTEAK